MKYNLQSLHKSECTTSPRVYVLREPFKRSYGKWINPKKKYKQPEKTQTKRVTNLFADTKKIS